jgi:hypothetical protein
MEQDQWGRDLEPEEEVVPDREEERIRGIARAQGLRAIVSALPAVKEYLISRGFHVIT